jgi:hypothetical protein
VAENAIAVINIETVVLPNLWSRWEEGSTDASQCGALRAKPVAIALLCALASQRRILVAEGLAEGEELGSNGLLICRPSTWPRGRDWNPTALPRQQPSLLAARITMTPMIETNHRWDQRRSMSAVAPKVISCAAKKDG